MLSLQRNLLPVLFLGVFYMSCSMESPLPPPLLEEANTSYATQTKPTTVATPDLSATSLTPDLSAYTPEVVPFGTECCSEPGQVSECWRKDAEEDGATCEDNDECSAGQSCTTTGLCTCASDADCNDGICTDDGVCGPSWCNGFYTCSCWGGCVWWHPEPKEDSPSNQCSVNDLNCCEGQYGKNPDDTPTGNPYPGFCSDSEACDSGNCKVDADCDDGNPCTIEICDPDSVSCLKDDRGCVFSVDEGASCTSDLGDDQSSDCANSVCHDLNGDACIIEALCTVQIGVEGSTCTQNPIDENRYFGISPRGDADDGSSCYELSCDDLGRCLASPVANEFERSCDDPDLFSSGLDNTCTNELCIDGLCAHSTAGLVGDSCDDDNNKCTAGDCDADGTCTADPANDVSCTVDQCNISACEPATGACVYSNDARFESACNQDGDGCSLEICECSVPPCACALGDCSEHLSCGASGSSIVCPNVGDECKLSACVDNAGPDNHAYTCSSVNVADGVICNSDDDGCTVDDSCSTGVCVASATAPDCESELAATYGAFDTICNTAICMDAAADATSYTCSFSTIAGGCAQDASGCTIDTCNITVVGNPAVCELGGAPDCSATPSTQCQVVSCTEDVMDPENSYQCTVSDSASGTACDDGNPCNIGETCDGAGVCGGGTAKCSPLDSCHTVACNATNGVCTQTKISDTCCANDGECDIDDCPGDLLPNDGCGTPSCDTGGLCTCEPRGVGSSCTDYSEADYPPNCYSAGECDGSGNCIPTMHPAYNNLCSDTFDPTDPSKLDTSHDAYLGSFLNTDAEGKTLTATGSTLCAFNSYTATGDDCVECLDPDGDGVCSATTRGLGQDGRDLVYVFEYETNYETQYDLFSYVIKAQANFDVAVYIQTEISNATNCPEGNNPDSDDPALPFNVASTRCSFPYNPGTSPPPPTVVEDECNTSGNTVYSQDCCDPCVDGANCGYKWCTRGYNTDNSSCDMCNPGDCDGLWTYPVDPFNCDKTTPAGDPAYGDYSSIASAVISPKGATDGSKHKVFVYVDGVDDAEGEFYLTVERRRWWASPCDRVNDDARVYDVTHPDSGSSIFNGTLENVVNSYHSGGGGGCGGYSCVSSDWSGVTSDHEPGTANEFWPAGEHFKIHRSSAEGSAKYCIETDESLKDSGGNDVAADLVVAIYERGNGYETICDAGYWDIFTERNNNGNDVQLEFTADPDILYLVELSHHDYMNRPCGTLSSDKCAYAVTVSEGACGSQCKAPLETPEATVDVDTSVAYVEHTFAGTIDGASGDDYATVASGVQDDVYVINNSTGSTRDVTFEVCSTGDAVLALFGCNQSAAARLWTRDSTGSGGCETRTYALPSSSRPYYLAVDSWNSPIGAYNLTVSWGTPPVTCIDPLTTWYSGESLEGTITITDASTPTMAGTTVAGVRRHDPGGGNLWDARDQLWKIIVNTSSDSNYEFATCNVSGSTNTYDGMMAIYDCVGNLVASDNDRCKPISGEKMPAFDATLERSLSPYYLVIDGKKTTTVAAAHTQLESTRINFGGYSIWHCSL